MRALALALLVALGAAAAAVAQTNESNETPTNETGSEGSTPGENASGGGNEAGPDTQDLPEEAGSDILGRDFGQVLLLVIGAFIIVGAVASWWVRKRYSP